MKQQNNVIIHSWSQQKTDKIVTSSLFTFSKKILSKYHGVALESFWASENKNLWMKNLKSLSLLTFLRLAEILRLNYLKCLFFDIILRFSQIFVLMSQNERKLTFYQARVLFCMKQIIIGIYIQDQNCIIVLYIEERNLRKTGKIVNSILFIHNRKIIISEYYVVS